MYGHSVFVVDASRDTVFRDVEIERCPSFGATILPLSENVDALNVHAKAAEEPLKDARTWSR